MKLLPLDPPIEEHNEILLISPREKKMLLHIVKMVIIKMVYDKRMPSDEIADDVVKLKETLTRK